MKKLFILAVTALVAGSAFAQDLDTVAITDKFDTGARGNAAGTGTFGASSPTGSEFLDYSGADITGGPIRYINSYAGASSGDAGNGESPVRDVTAGFLQPDRNLTAGPTVAANAQSGVVAPSGNTAVAISDDGGLNALYFGESNDSNYYVQVDVYCWDQSTLTSGTIATPVYEAAYLSLRNGRDNDPNVTDFTYTPDRQGSYSIWYDYQLREIKAGKWTVGNTFQAVQGRFISSYTQFGSTVPVVAAGWNRFRIEANGNHIKFHVNGSQVADVYDSDFIEGRPGLAYREANVASADERTAIFDNLQAGPQGSFANVKDALLY